MNTVILAILAQKIWSESTTALNKDTTFCIKNHIKNTSKYLQKAPQSDPKWLLLGAWEPPWNLHAIRVANYTQIWPLKLPKWDPFGSLRKPWDPTKSTKVIEECSKDADKKNNGKKSGIRTLPNLQNYCFTIVKHTFSDIHLILKKSIKWLPNDLKIDPKWAIRAPKDPSNTFLKASRKQTRKKNLKNTKK